MQESKFWFVGDYNREIINKQILVGYNIKYVINKRPMVVLTFRYPLLFVKNLYESECEYLNGHVYFSIFNI